MVFYKNFLDIDKKEEPEKFNIFMQMEIHGKAIVENPDKKEYWHSLGTEIGKASHYLTDGNKSHLLMPPMKTKNTNPEHFVVITPNINVIVKEQKITDTISRFFLIRK
jgi:hypothetical protein